MKKGLLERLSEGLVIGDGGSLFILEKRGYVMAGAWTPEAVVENPEAVRQMHREFVRAGSNVLQAFTFFCSDDRMDHINSSAGSNINWKSVTNAACRIAREVADESKDDVLVAGSISLNPAYTDGKGKQYVQKEVKKQCDIFIQNKVDFIICEFILHIEELEWTIEEAKKTGLPVMATLSVGQKGDLDNVSLVECGIRMAKAKADVLGLHCIFDPFMSLKSMAELKEALDENNLKPHLAMQPCGFFTSGSANHYGYTTCPEFPFAMEPRLITRFDVHKYARKAYDMGVRYIGGCCGFEPYHIRAIAEELSEENSGHLPPGSEKHIPWGGTLVYSNFDHLTKRASRSYWENIVPHSGRPKPPTFELPAST